MIDTIGTYDRADWSKFATEPRFFPLRTGSEIGGKLQKTKELKNFCCGEIG
jgi:hypothetical protein